MRISDGYLLRKIDDMYVVITMGEALNKFNGMIKLNDTGAFIWEKMKTDIELDQLVEQFKNKYGISYAEAEHDVKEFIENVRPTGCIEDSNYKTTIL